MTVLDEEEIPVVPDSVALGPAGIRVARGEHICAFYLSLAERDAIMLPFLRDGLDAAHKCLCMTDSGTPEAVLGSLGAELDLAAVLDHRQLKVAGAQGSFLSGGVFSSERMLDYIELSFDETVRDGFDFTRVIGEARWVLFQMLGVEELALYESGLNKVMPRHPAVMVCLYELARFSGGVLVDILKTHPKMLLGGMVLDNPYYLEPDEFLALRQ